MRLTLPKDALITKPWQYRQVYQHGQRIWGKGLTLIYLDNRCGQDRLGISVGGQKLAVRRNRIKRLLKEFYRHHRTLPSQVAQQPPGSGVDLVIATNQKFQPRGLADIQALFEKYTGQLQRSGDERVDEASRRSHNSMVPPCKSS